MMEVWCSECGEFVGEFPEEELHQLVECPHCRQEVEIT